ncbi:MAG TPA: DnaA N-terminal domain-containing protein, partial [Beijerinckiaceae bacterium]
MEEAQSANEVWSRVKRRLRAELGEDVFASWFGRLELEAIVDGCARLTVPTRFLKSWIESHYADRVLATYRSEAPAVERISVAMRGSQVREAVAKRPDAARPCATTGAQAASGDLRLAVVPERPRDDRGEQDLNGAPLDARLTFASFMQGQSNALAHAAAERIARHQGPALYNPLYLHAGVGLGKTHLLHAVGQEARAQGRRVIYLTA